jgi:hypothetical protein
VGGGHHIRRVEELDNRLNGQIGAGRWRSKEHHELGCHELLPLGHRSAWSLDASAKYNTATTLLWSLAIGGGDEENIGVGSSDEGRGRQQARLQRRNLASQR